MKRLKTLRVRFALWTSGWLLLVLILLEAFIYFNFARELAQSVDDALRLAAAQLFLEIDEETLLLENVSNNVASSMLGEQFSVQILDLSGEVRQTYGPYQEIFQPLTQSITFNQLDSFTTVIDPATHQPVRAYSAPIVEDEQVVGVLQVAQSLLGVHQSLNQLLTILLIAGPFFVCVSSLGGYILASRALRPIDQITNTARHISTKDLSSRLNLPPTDDEVGRLAATFDTMLARLEDGFRRERQFTTDASHELRTPLTNMRTIISSTLSRPRTPAEYEQALTDLAEETGRMKILAEGLLLLARQDVSSASLYEPLDLSILVQDVAESLRPLAEAKALALNCYLPLKLTLIGDKDGLIRLFINLLDNAIKYTQQGQITISLNQKTDEYIEVAVADSGIGIAPAHLSSIFDRFYRIDESRATSGAGLGLAIALSVAQMHGGTIRVKSEVEQGTVFIVQLARDLNNYQVDDL